MIISAEHYIGQALVTTVCKATFILKKLGHSIRCNVANPSKSLMQHGHVEISPIHRGVQHTHTNTFKDSVA